MCSLVCVGFASKKWRWTFREKRKFRVFAPKEREVAGSTEVDIKKKTRERKKEYERA